MPKVMATAIVGALLLVACGDDGSGGLGALIDEGSAPGSGEGDVVIGGDLDRPDWLPDDFYLPEDLAITSAFQDTDSRMMSLSGVVEGSDRATLHRDAVDGLSAAGYELLTDSGEIAVFVRNGVGQVRVRASELLGELTLTVDIDDWNDDELDEIRASFVEEIVVRGSATGEIGGVAIAAEGECYLRGGDQVFVADDVSVSITVDETTDPITVFADTTTDEGIVYQLDQGGDVDAEASPGRFAVSGTASELNVEGGDQLRFSVEATCDV